MAEADVDLDTTNQAADDTGADQVSDTDNNENPDDAADVSEEVTKLQEQNKKLYERAKKAEAEAKALKKTSEPKPDVTVQPQVQLTALDAVLLSKSDISEKEDIETLVEYANFKHISVAEAMKTPVMKAELAQRAQERKSAQATHTGGGKRSSATLTSDQILANAEKGIMPKSDDDWDKIAEARAKARRK